MSKLIATITKIQNVGSLNLVTFDFYDSALKMISLDLDETIKVGAKVNLGVKPTSVALAKELHGELSYSNQINATIESIDNGELLSSIVLSAGENSFESIITADSSKRMRLTVGDEVTALLKVNEISILGVAE